MRTTKESLICCSQGNAIDLVVRKDIYPNTVVLATHRGAEPAQPEASYCVPATLSYTPKNRLFRQASKPVHSLRFIVRKELLVITLFSQFRLKRKKR